ncbi:phosphatidylinositol N-acetylglucosaminyltransferase [Schizopora paradoxa]|uniref:Phosphatidylinositol N-acetylglucosaminyltransferase n=1 Tax=Schizopora paradoxa TaxID=27342 RepID=A0A0H2S7P1_9AGAM|nr:phosphatidylinositol N-acetylglucosaminyltransferase [Schizopora paradoxa]
MSTETWERVLWKQQPFPDNYIPDSFLSALKKNANFRPYSYWPLSLASCAVTQHISILFIFLVTFVHIYDASWDPRILVWLSIGMFIVGYLVWEILEIYIFGTRLGDFTSLANALKSSVLVFLSLLALSPVLRTLTASTSSDSIWALTSCLLGLNVLLGDYTPPRDPKRIRERLTSVLSMNAAMSGSVVLASRLQDDISVFALMLFSIQMFALFPILRTRILLTPPATRILLTITLTGLSVYLTCKVSTIVTCILICILVFVTFAAPAMLVWSQKYKNELRGPWDVAVPQVR